ncbi:MAG: protein phosphatase 2C domain-containing protein [Epulopiscium sp.]|nr:protein phosphatase 2C domain-containing protein [Candidatus Epulonipiscium sp.]
MWKTVNYEVCGRGHKKDSIPCQDKTYSSYIKNVNIIALADGAGSARLSHYGAEVVIKAASEYISNNFDAVINNEDGKEVKINILNYLLDALKNKSTELSCDLKDLASTFLMVAVKDDVFLIIHIGDGVIGYLKGHELKIASRPENGEFANTTTFVTSKDALSSMKLFRGKTDNIHGFVLMSDGTSDSLYNKKDATLAPVITKMMHRNAILDHDKIFEKIKQSFDSVIVNNTLDDCSIAIMSRKSEILCDYQDMNDLGKCDLLGIVYGTNSYKQQISKYDYIVNYLHKPRTLEQVSRQLYIKKKYARKHLDKLLATGLITRVGHKYAQYIK